MATAQAQANECIDGLSARVKTGKVQLLWSPAVATERYEVLRSTSISGPFSEIGETLPPASTFLDDSVQNELLYYYQIQRIPDDGSAPCLSALIGAIAPAGRTQTTVVPDIIGETEATAEAALTAAVLATGNISASSSVTVPPGQVFSQDPPPNSSVPQGTLVDFVVSSGPEVDVTPPNISISSPVDGAVLNNEPVVVSGSASDDTALSGVTVNGVAATLSGDTFSVTVPLSEGANTLTAIATDASGNTASSSVSVTFTVLDSIPPRVVITSPADGAEVSEAGIQVTGTGSDETALAGVIVNGVAATLSGDTFSATILLSEGANTLTAIATDAAGNTASSSVSVTFTVADSIPPQVVITSPADGAEVSEASIQVTGTASDDTALIGVTVNGVAATLSGDTFTATVLLAEGANTLTAVATDVEGNTSSASITVTRIADTVDTTPPEVSITSPADGGLIIGSQPVIEVSYSDDNSGVDTASLSFTANGVPLTVDCQFNVTAAQCIPASTLPEGSVIVVATVSDIVGNSSNSQITFVIDSQPLVLSITAPANGLITADADIQVTGTVSAGVVSIDVNGVIASVSGGGFNVTVPLREGRNMLVAVGTRASGRTGTASVDVTRDIVAPIVSIDTPSDGFVSVNNTIAVTGKVNDIVNGGTDAHVLVNGIEATVAGGSYMVMDIPLVRGSNTITAIGTDTVGNEGSRSITVTFQPPVGARMTEGSGNGQAAQVNQVLATPLMAIVQDDLGNPVAGRVVKFEVTRNSGNLTVNAGDTPVRILQVPTDGSGKASVLFMLGDTAGEGNNRVKASAVGVAGEVEFCASGLGDQPEKILMVNGDNQRGVTGFPLANPLEALIVDKDGNPLNGVEVTFSVVKGSGNLNGTQSQVKVTGVDGLARAVLTLALEPGINNNIVNATFAGLTGLPATFVSSGLAPGNPEDTKFSGVVLDNGHTPIPGAVVTIPGSVVSDTTDDEGQFLLNDVPVGHIHLHIDPASSPRLETYPPLDFETVTVAGQTNILGQPILLPAIQTEGSKLVGGNEDVTLKMPDVAGLELTVFANSVTCVDGSSQCQVTISQVHLDKVPMPPPSGTIFMPPAWTIQPSGTRFDPPARISIPNDGLPPGRVIDIFQFDHTLNEFINVGKGTVTDDAFVIISDPGFGITRAGWGGCGQPQPPDTCTRSCGDLNPDECQEVKSADCPACPSLVAADSSKELAEQNPNDCVTNTCGGSEPNDGEQPDPGVDVNACRKCESGSTVADGSKNGSAAGEQCCFDGVLVPNSPIKDLDQCPNRLANAELPEINGCTGIPDNPNLISVCGAPFGEGVNRPSFTDACNSHDTCFDTCNSGKNACDNRIRQDMLDICALATIAACREDCRDNAFTIASGVSSIPEIAFYNPSQRRVCNCCQ